MEESRKERKENGQVLVLFALMLVVLCGLVALAVDAGTIFLERRHLQNAADSAAIAGTLELPQSSALANDKAMEWAQNNGIDLNDGDQIQISVSNDQSSVTVEVTRETPFFFGRVLGLSTIDVSASATAQVGSPDSLSGILPFGVLESAINYDGSPTVLKYDSNNPMNGNFAALRVDGNGSKVLEETIKNGSETAVCATSQPSCSDPTLSTETGNTISAVRNGFNFLLDSTSEQCDDFDEVLIPRGDGSYNVYGPCNPFAGSSESYKLVLLPVVESYCNGNCDVTLLYFVAGYLNDLESCTGNACEVTITFVKTVVDPTSDAILGIYDEDSGVKFVRLIE